MPYNSSAILPGERANKSGHFPFIESDFVQEYLQQLRISSSNTTSEPLTWKPLPKGGTGFQSVFSVDGSVQTITASAPPKYKITYIQVTLLHLLVDELCSDDTFATHPDRIQQRLGNASKRHVSFFPLMNLTLSNTTLYHTNRELIFWSLQDPTWDGELLETLRWIAYEKWSGKQKALPGFQCPYCGFKKSILPYDSIQGICQKCGKQIYLTDMLGIHLEMTEDSASESIATAYMNITEFLILFTKIREYWEKDRAGLAQCLFLRDGPLTLRAHYSKLVDPIRRLLAFANQQNTPIYLIGQEKTGRFADHIEHLELYPKEKQFAMPNTPYIHEKIIFHPNVDQPYGHYTNIGAKIYVNLGGHQCYLLNIPPKIPLDQFQQKPDENQLIGFTEIMTILPKIIGHRYANSLLPLELAHDLASIPNFPGQQVLQKLTNVYRQRNENLAQE